MFGIPSRALSRFDITVINEEEVVSAGLEHRVFHVRRRRQAPNIPQLTTIVMRPRSTKQLSSIHLYSDLPGQFSGSSRNYVRATTCYEPMTSDTTVMNPVRLTVASAFRTVPEGLRDCEVSGVGPFAEPEQRSENTIVFAART